MSPWLRERPAADPDLRFVVFMCLCWHEAYHGRLTGPITNELAEQWARAALIDPDDVAHADGEDDVLTARALNVPVEQLQAVRAR